MSSGTKALLGAGAAAAVAILAWHYWPNEERSVRRRLSAFTRDFNESTTDGIGMVARAARIGSYFTPDVVVDLGSTVPPIRGRETLIGMTARLQPRTSAFVLELRDVNVKISQPASAEVGLTALFRRRSLDSGE